MNAKCSLVLAVILVFTSSSCNIPATAALPAVTPEAVLAQPLPTLAPMLERATPAVVNIATEGRVLLRRNPLMDDPFFRRFFDFPQRPRERKTQSLGSGVVVNAQRGYIVTNHHVIERADTIKVTLRDGRQLQAKVIGSDPETDVAVIQIPSEGLTALPLANSDALRVGDFVVAIGNPFGLGQTVTSGIVSALGRTGLGIQGYEDFIQTDASINPGNSGGALVNLRGELVGINTAIIAPGGGNVGIGFAVPSNMVERLMNQLVAHGEVRRGQLGVSIQDLTPDLAQAFSIRQSKGALIVKVVPGSGADKAGLRSGDVVVGVNGRTVDDAGDLRNAIGLLQVGDRVKLDILRDGKAKKVTAKIREFREEIAQGKSINRRLAGAVFRDIPPGTPGHGEGVLLASIESGSPAAQTGLRKGDVITSANRQPVASLEELQRIAANSETLLLNIQRGRRALFLLIQ